MAPTTHDTAHTDQKHLKGGQAPTSADTGFPSRTNLVLVLLEVIENKPMVAPSSLLPLLEERLGQETMLTDAKRAYLREQIRKITDVFPDQDKHLPKTDIYAILNVYQGQPVTILADYDIRLIVTEIIADMSKPNYVSPNAMTADLDRSDLETELGPA